MPKAVGSVQTKIITLIFLVVVITETIVVAFIYSNQRASLLSATDRSAYLNTQTLFLSLRNMMLSGEAPVVVRTMRDLKDIDEFKAIDIYRVTEELAFSDFKTMDSVNGYQSAFSFKPSERIMAPAMSDTEKDRVVTLVKKALATKLPAFALDARTKEADYFTPIDNLSECMTCHGSAYPLRGVIRFKLSVAGVYNQIDRTRNLLILFFLGVGTILLTVMIVMLRRVIIKPVLTLGEIVNRVGDGDFEARTAFKRNDEIGQLADKINAMTIGLNERFKLSKYVSSSTFDIVRSGFEHTEDKRVALAILFSDIRGFTTYSESNPPEKVMKNLNRVLEAQAEAVHEFGGDVDKFVGDEIMAVFPDARSAVYCAAKMLRSVHAVDAEIGEGLKVGIGINFGDVIRGHLGSTERKEYAAIGDTVNVAARLCSTAKADSILVSASVYELVKDEVIAEEVANQTIKGKKDFVTFYALKSLKGTF